VGTQKQYVVCLNSNMLGMPYEPATDMSTDNTMRPNPNETALHPLIRNWFGSQTPGTSHVNIDPYRRAMSLDYGYTYPLNGEGEYLINTYRYQNPDDFNSGTPETNTPYMYKDGESGPSFGSLGRPLYDSFALDGLSSDTLDLHFNEKGWNESLPSSPDYSYGATPGSAVSPYYASLLDEENRDEWNEGVPYFNKYLMGLPQSPSTPLAASAADPRMTSAGLIGTYNGLFGDVAARGGHPPISAHTLFDHTFGYTNANTYNNEDPNLPDPLYPGVTVESTYNFYIDSAPNYEDVIAPANIPECILPNFYMLQSSILQHLTSAPERLNAYLEQVSVGTGGVPFQVLFYATSNPAIVVDSPNISEGYWNLYSTTLSNIDSTAMTEFEGKYKNIVVPLGSLNFISDQNEASSFSGDPANPGPSGPFTALSAYPFYNKITLQPIGIPSDNDPELGPERAATGWITDPDFLRGLLDANGAQGTLTAAETTCFVRSLQLLIANSYNPNASIESRDKLTGLVAQDLRSTFPRRASLSMDLNFMGTGFNEESDQPQEIQHTLGKSQPIKICAEVDKILDDGTDLKDLTDSEGPYPYYYINLEKLTPNETDINYSILRDAIAGNDYSTAATWEKTTDAADRGQIHTAIKDYTRNLNSVFKGQLSNVSPLMYLIEKRRIPDGELSVPLSVEPVQRIFITRDFRNPGNPSPITYYDTQIKYGVRYQYDVRVINIVFGTQYEYTNVASDPDQWYTEVENTPLASSGRALGNALGFYNEEESHVTMMGNYLVGGTLDADGSQHNYLKLSDETDLISPEDTNLMNPTMYFSDEGELGWPSTPYQTDIGEDPGWDSANGTVSFKEGTATNKPVGQSGYYVFGGSHFESTLPALEDRPPFVPWTQDFAMWFKTQGPPSFTGLDYNLHSSVGTTQGLTISAPQPGGFYKPWAVANMLGNLKVKVVEGLGHDGNSTGGLVPWIAEVQQIPEIPVDEPVSVGMCEWVQLYHEYIATAFRHWYTQVRIFDAPTENPSAGVVFYGNYKYHLQSGPDLSPVMSSYSSTMTAERWWNGDSNCLYDSGLPVLWGPPSGLGTSANQDDNQDYVTHYPTSDQGAQSRDTAAWYAPNWTAIATVNQNRSVWHPHSIYQIVYWLLHGVPSAHWSSTVNHDYADDPADPGTRAYLYPKADLGLAHGNKILDEFRQWWNDHYDSPSVNSPSRSHVGVTTTIGQSIEDATLSYRGDPWTASKWKSMIAMLYSTSCLSPGSRWNAYIDYPESLSGGGQGSGLL